MKTTRLIFWTLLSVALLSACHKDVLKDKKQSPLYVEEGHAANCYIISPGRELHFPAVKGNTKTKFKNAREATVLWETGNTVKTVKKGDIVKSVSYAGEKITLVAGDNPGNALVALEDGDGQILWSWHIWVTKYDPDKTITTIRDGSKQYFMMDRNLGALTSNALDPLSCGLLYAPSRKDPFPGMASFQTSSQMDISRMSVRGSMAEGCKMSVDIEGDLNDYMVKNPTQFVLYGKEGTEKAEYLSSEYERLDLWRWYGSSKAISDPCPYGYMLPVYDVWSRLTTSNQDYFNETYFSFQDQSPGLWFPYSGYAGFRGTIICVQDDLCRFFSAYHMNSNNSSTIQIAWVLYYNGSDPYPSPVSGREYKSQLFISNDFRGGAVRCVKM